MQTPKEILPYAQSFITIIFMGLVAAIYFNLLSNVIRAIGDSKTPLLFLGIAVFINIALDLVLIIGFLMGVEAAGIGTVVAQFASVLLCLIYIYKKIPILQLHKSDFAITKKDLADHARIAFPMAFQASIIAIGAVILQSALNSLGTDVVAAQTASGRIDQFATLPMMSFGITMATYTAQNYGAKQYGRIIQGVKQGLLLSCSFAVLAGAGVIIFGHNLATLFVSAKETHVLSLAQTYFNINGSLYWVLAILFILRYTLQGLGKSAVPTIAGIVELFCRSFAAIVLTIFFGFVGAAVASPLAWFGSVCVLVTSYVRAMKHLKELDQKQKAEKALEN
jgi:putative MATE family efflux protein